LLDLLCGAVFFNGEKAWPEVDPQHSPFNIHLSRDSYVGRLGALDAACIEKPLRFSGEQKVQCCVTPIDTRWNAFAG